MVSILRALNILPDASIRRVARLDQAALLQLALKFGRPLNGAELRFAVLMAANATPRQRGAIHDQIAATAGGLRGDAGRHRVMLWLKLALDDPDEADLYTLRKLSERVRAHVRTRFAPGDIAAFCGLRGEPVTDFIMTALARALEHVA